MTNQITTAARALLAALDAYREQATRQICTAPACCYCPQGYCTINGCSWQGANWGGNWLAVEVAAAELERELDKCD